MSEELRTCPLCDGPGAYNEWAAKIECAKCGLKMTQPFVGAGAPARAWNHRIADAEIAQLRARVAELEAQKEKLAEFARESIRENGLEIGHPFSKMAERLGIITWFEVTAQHVESGYVDGYDVEPGDMAFEFADWVKGG